jgi:hypothetical protein
VGELEPVRQYHLKSGFLHDEKPDAQRPIAAVDYCEHYDLEDDLEFRQKLALAAVVPAFSVPFFVDMLGQSSRSALPLAPCPSCSSQFHSTSLPQKSGA